MDDKRGVYFLKKKNKHSSRHEPDEKDDSVLYSCNECT